jgi:glutathione S-transferase
VLVDGEKTVSDSQAIAEYLEEAYPAAPSLFGGPEAHALMQFIRRWVDGVLVMSLVKVLVPDVFRLIHPKDRAYFRDSREKRLGISIEGLAEQRAEHLKAFEAVLAPLRATLKGQKFVSGDTPLYADHIIFGALQWARKTSSTELWGADDPVARWMEAVLGYYGDGVR